MVTTVSLETPPDLVAIVGSEPVDIELRLHNHGNTTEDFFLTCTRHPGGWIFIPVPAINRVPPDSSEKVTLRVFPPTIVDPFPQPFPIEIQVHTSFPSAVLVVTELMLSWVTG